MLTVPLFCFLVNDLRNEIEMIKNRPCNDQKCKLENLALRKSLKEAKEEVCFLNLKKIIIIYIR